MNQIKVSLWVFLLIFFIIVLLAVIVFIIITPIKPVDEMKTQVEAQSEDAVAQAKQEVEEVLSKTETAVLNSDMEAFENLWADDYILTSRTGKVRTKSERIAILKSGELD